MSASAPGEGGPDATGLGAELRRDDLVSVAPAIRALADDARIGSRSQLTRPGDPATDHDPVGREHVRTFATATPR